MLNIYKKFSRSPSRAQTGAPFVVGSTDDGTDVIIYVHRLHTSNTAFKAANEAKRRANQFKLNNLDEAARAEFQEELGRKAFLETCIAGWTDNMCDANGALIAYTDEAIAQIERDLPELIDALMYFAATAENYVGTFDEDATLKN